MASRRKAVKIKPTGPGAGQRLMGLARVAWRPCLIWVLPAAALLAACLIGLNLSRAYVTASPKYHVTAPKLEMPSPAPLWWEQAFEDQINQSCDVANGMSILDDSLLESIAAGYLRCPWVKRVRWVKKRFPGRISASIDLREPAAAVAYNIGNGQRAYYLVADDGVRLPKIYRHWRPRGLSVPFITGVGVNPPRPGQPWSEASVADAIAIVALLERSELIRTAVNITEVDVSNYRGRQRTTESEFVLFAERNCRIIWGRAPNTVKPGELSVARKIERLEEHLRRGDPVHNRILNLRYPGPVVADRRYGPHADGS